MESQVLGLLGMIVTVGAVMFYFRKSTPAAQFAEEASSASGMDEVIRLAQAGKKAEALRLYREQTGLSLAEAKDNVDAFAANAAPPHRVPMGAVPPALKMRFITGLEEEDGPKAPPPAPPPAPSVIVENAAPRKSRPRRGVASTPPPREAPNDKLYNVLKLLVRAGDLVTAIKLYRDKTGADLAEAKQAVDAVRAGRPFPP